MCGDAEEKSTRQTVFLFSLKDGKLNKKKISSSLEHDVFDFYSSMMKNGRELLVVACPDCLTIRLYDFQTGEGTTVFSGSPVIAFGEGSCCRIFVQTQDKSVQEMDSSGPEFKGPLRTLIQTDTTCSSLCYIPPPVHALVLGDTFQMAAISLDTDKQIYI